MSELATTLATELGLKGTVTNQMVVDKVLDMHKELTAMNATIQVPRALHRCGIRP